MMLDLPAVLGMLLDKLLLTMLICDLLLKYFCWFPGKPTD